ncbi:hypothetical protein [Cellulophaga tyrosinoxydans]|uniref:Uncharacterized protein n=1 Tax=Cellulophaga tyrosinoxydans TaxID=504486 RepID=A0A1W1ZZI4_9FLAO|nr:hypothetical protein [Cellulophaga tyrosinoxydans]SMC53776.1 hypothetical protein SAMN05660703_1673 [Cellulophaga tyrosinoxydans]
MKHISAHRVLPYFSFLLFIIVLNACKYEAKKEFNLEETRALEKNAILNLLSQAKNEIENENLQGAIVLLDSIINNYGTYDEVETAYILKEEAQRHYMIKKIISSTDIDSLFVFITDYNSFEIKDAAKKRIGEVIKSTQNPQVLQDFIASNRLPEFRVEAKTRQQNLLEEQKNNLYSEALKENSAQTWKNFIALYPDHPNNKQIEDKIIELEVDDIFSGTHGEIPSSNLSGVANYINSDIKIKNDTPYTLTIRYSGKENKRIIIPSGNTQRVDLISGEYRVTASVNASRVSNYAGIESLNGSYTSSYYLMN